MIESERGGERPALGSVESLRSARERAGLSLQDVSQRLKMPIRVLQALEAGQWDQLGGAVFVRGQLRSYGRLLRLDVEPLLEQLEQQAVARPAELVSHSHTPKLRYFLESFKRRAIYVVLTAVIATPVWMALRPQLGNAPDGTTASLDAVPAPAVEPQAAKPRSTEARRPQATPYVASMAPLPRASEPGLTLRFKGDSWVEITAPDGRRIEQALIRAGEERHYAQGEIGRVKLGDANAVEVQQAGSTVDLAPYQRANVARFTVSSEGSLAPVRD